MPAQANWRAASMLGTIETENREKKELRCQIMQLNDSIGALKVVGEKREIVGYPQLKT
jgi:hypothetical protein